MSHNSNLLGIAILTLFILTLGTFGAAVASDAHTTLTKSPSHEGMSSETYHVALITGDSLLITKDEQGKLSIAVDGQRGLQDFRVLQSPRGTYVFPKGIDFKKMDTELFNIDYLIEEGYCNMSYLPVLIDYKKEGITGIDEVASIKRLEESDHITMGRTYTSVSTFSAKLSVEGIEETVETLEKTPEIEKIWLDRKVSTSLYESVPLINVPGVWQEGYNGSGIEIAMLDTGIDDTHPDLDDLDDNPSTTDPKVVRGVDFTDENTTDDLDGHGTFCAGIVAGTGYGATLLGGGTSSSLFNTLSEGASQGEEELVDAYVKHVLATHKEETSAVLDEKTTSQSHVSETGTPDAYEPDNNYTQANWISTDGTEQKHNFHAEADHDWVRFNASSNTTYKIETSELGPDCDTVLYLYSTDGSTEIVHNDDYEYETLASLIIWKCETAGAYYVEVEDWDDSEYGNDSYYNLSVAEFVPPAEFTDVYSDCAVDFNSDGMYDFLVVDVEVNVREAGRYEIVASLYENGTSHWVDFAYNNTYLSVGVQSVQLKFSGNDLYKNGYNGTYDLKWLYLYHYNKTYTLTNHRELAYTTRSYNYTQFQQFKRYVGVAPGAKLWNVKVLDRHGTGYSSQIIEGIEYAAYGPDLTPDTGDEADIISMSMGGTPTDGNDPLSMAVNDAVSQGVVVVVAAGNNGMPFTIESPGVASEAITVGASTKYDEVAWFSSMGPGLDLGVKPDVVAPGRNIVSARANGTSLGEPVNEYYTEAGGTSASTAHVSGACALLLQAYPTKSPAQLKNALVSTAKDLSTPDKAVSVYEQGGGRINVMKALSANILIEPSVISFGKLNSTSSKVITFRNIDTAPHTLELSVESMDVFSDAPVSCASLNKTSLVLSAGQSGTVLLTVNATGLNQSLYSGRMTATTGSEVLYAVFGFAKLNKLTVNKINRTGAAGSGDIVAVFTDNYTYGFEEWNEGITDGNGTAIFYLPDGVYQVMSGWGSEPSLSVYTAMDNVSVMDDVSITLDERTAKCISFDYNKTGQIMSEKYDEFYYTGENTSVSFSSLYGYPNDTRTYIVPTSAFKSIFIYTYYPEAYYNESAPWFASAPEWHKLLYNLSSITDNKTFIADYSKLAQSSTEYRVALVPELAWLGMNAWHPDMWGSVTYLYAVDAPLQRYEWLSPEPIEYDGDYEQSADWTTTYPSWDYLYEGTYSEGERSHFSVGEHPLSSGVEVEIIGNRLSVLGSISVDTYNNAFMNWNNYVSGNITVVQDGAVVGQWNIWDVFHVFLNFTGEPTFNITIEGSGSQMLSTHTKTELNFTANASGDYMPPWITMVAPNSTLNNTITTGNVEVIVYAADESEPAVSLEYSLDNGTTWRPAVFVGTHSKTDGNYTVSMSSFSLGRLGKAYVSLRTRAVDANGNSITQTTIAGFYVAASPLTNATIALEPHTQMVKPNDYFTAYVNTSCIKPAYSAQYTVLFDPSVLEVVSQTQGTFLTSDGNSSTVIINQYNNTNGTAEYGEFRKGTTTGITGNGTLASIQFHVNSSATFGEYAVVFRPSETIIGDVNASEMDITMKGMGVSITDNLPPVAIATTKHAINNALSPTYFNGTASYDSDGTVASWAWDFGDGTNGTWAIVSHAYTTCYYDGSSYVPFSATLTVHDNKGAVNSTHLPVVVFMAGDANGDGVANILDAALVGLHWNAHYGSVEYHDGADLNNDDVVNVLDAAIVGLNWNKRAGDAGFF
ncbi:MAG: S8 family serine peptidase [Methermicoccaceae archaeon]